MEPLEVLQKIHSQILDPERLPVAAATLLIVSIVGMLSGPVRSNICPAFWQVLTSMFGGLGNRLDKPERAEKDLLTRGMILTLVAVSASFCVGSGIDLIISKYPTWRIIDIVALSILMTSGSVWYALVRLHKAMTPNASVPKAFYTIAISSRADLAVSDEYTITRTGIFLGARCFDKAVVTPVLWYLIAGFPAAFLYGGLAALAWRFGREGATTGFGSVALALEKLMGFVPNAFAGLLIALAGILTPTAGTVRSLGGLAKISRKGRAGYYEGGAPMTAIAYALKIGLGGPIVDRDGRKISRAWAGPEGASARLEAGHLRRALYILIMAHMLFLTTLLAAIVFTGREIF